MDLELRTITAEDLPAYRIADQYGFGFRPEGDEQLRAHSSAELDRAYGVFEGDDVVASGRLFSLDLTLPGGASVPAGGVSWIAVRPTHRRRGLLTRMMRALADDAARRGEPAMILTASEGGIYSRFGYGVATRAQSLRMERAHLAFADPEPRGRVRMVEPAEARKIAPDVFERVRRSRPGAVSRPSSWWDDEWARPEELKKRFDAIYEVDGRAEGFVVYEVIGDWELGFAEMTVKVHELVGTDAGAEAALWRFVCSIDLTKAIEVEIAPVDLELPHRLRDGRQVRVTSVHDFVWLRPLDVPTLLTRREWAVDDRLILDVLDPDRPEGAAAGRFLLDTTGDVVQCERSDGEPDLVLGAADLGSVLLGDTRTSTLVRAGRVHARTARAAERADLLFTAERLPYAFTWF
jgi:predicted acetyltransferase